MSVVGIFEVYSVHWRPTTACRLAIRSLATRVRADGVRVSTQLHVPAFRSPTSPARLAIDLSRGGCYPHGRSVRASRTAALQVLRLSDDLPGLVRRRAPNGAARGG